MTDIDDMQPDDPLTPEEEARVRLLTPSELKRIDEYLLSHITLRWQKVARVVAMTMGEVDHIFPDIPTAIYSLRVKYLAESGVIEAAGNLNRMRFSEIRLKQSGEKLGS
jgi:hypothetical protein